MADARGFLLYIDYKEQFSLLDDAELGELVRALMQYFETGEIVTMSPVQRMRFASIKSHIDRDREKYINACEKKSKAVKKRWQTSQSTNGYKSIDMNNDEYISIDIYSDVDNIKEKEKEKEKIKEKERVRGISKDIPNNTRFQKPSIDEIKDFCHTHNLNVDAERFYDYYESNGWMVGKNKMKDFKRCLRNWARKEKPSNPLGMTEEDYKGYDIL